MRRALTWAWIGYTLCVAWWWLGLTGAALAMLCLHRLRWSVAAGNSIQSEFQSESQSEFQSECQVMQLTDATFTNYWLWSFAVCVQAGGQTHWILRDELPAHEWSALRRYLKINLPAHALGLSMSK